MPKSRLSPLLLKEAIPINTENKKSFILYYDSRRTLELLAPEQIGHLMLALFDYAEMLEDGDLSPREALSRFSQLDDMTTVAFCFMAAGVRRDTLKWQKRQANYLAGVRKRKGQQESEAPVQPSEASAWDYVE